MDPTLACLSSQGSKGDMRSAKPWLTLKLHNTAHSPASPQPYSWKFFNRSKIETRNPKNSQQQLIGVSFSRGFVTISYCSAALVSLSPQPDGMTMASASESQRRMSFRSLPSMLPTWTLRTTRLPSPSAQRSSPAQSRPSSLAGHVRFLQQSASARPPARVPLRATHTDNSEAQVALIKG